jgi:hypothetical protein
MSTDRCERVEDGLQNRLEWPPARLSNVCADYGLAYSNAGGKPWHSAAFNGTPRIQIAISERAAAIC